jgi:hypothetical protein
LLDPSGFKLPYMGKDKFIQLMRAGLNYDRKSGRFVVRRVDNLQSVEERVAQIVAKPIRFKRPDQAETVSRSQSATIKECYVNSKPVPCAECEFVENCPTAILEALKFCLCDDCLADPNAYSKYVEKNSAAVPIALTPTAKPKDQKRSRSRKKT